MSRSTSKQSSSNDLWGLLRNWLFISVGVLLASFTSDGIGYESKTWLFLAAALIGVFNSVLKPILVLFSLPFIILTMGLGLLVVNAAIFGLVAALLPGFSVESFGAAIWGGLVVSISAMLLHALTGKKAIRVKVNSGPSRSQSGRSSSRRDDDDVIDI